MEGCRVHLDSLHTLEGPWLSLWVFGHLRCIKVSDSKKFLLDYKRFCREMEVFWVPVTDVMYQIWYSRFLKLYFHTRHSNGSILDVFHFCMLWQNSIKQHRQFWQNNGIFLSAKLKWFGNYKKNTHIYKNRELIDHFSVNVIWPFKKTQNVVYLLILNSTSGQAFAKQCPKL